MLLDENIEFEVNPNDVSLSSFRKRGKLIPSVWKNNETLDSRIRLKLLDIADDFWKFVNITWVEPNAIILTGSICNFNWSEFSDIDLHLVVDFNEVDDRTEFVREYFDSKKNEWNNEHENLKMNGHAVELYVQDIGEEPESGGIYDLEENNWIRKPKEEDIHSIGVEKYSIKDKAAEIMTIIDDMIDSFESTDDSHEIEEIGDDAEYLWKKIKSLRKDSLEKDGESGSGNIVYKVMRRMGYLDKLWDLRTMIYDRLNSITESTKKVYVAENKLHLISENTAQLLRNSGYNGNIQMASFNESVRKYIRLLKIINEEVVADGNSEHNPYAKRWKAERDTLKNFLVNNGKIMTSKENGKQYKVYFDSMLSELIGYNYCICIQWDPIKLKPGSVIYVRAFDKFTNRLFNAQFDTRGVDNMTGTYDDIASYNS